LRQRFCRQEPAKLEDSNCLKRSFFGVDGGIHRAIVNYLTNGGDLEKAQQMAAHESPRTTKLLVF